MGGINVLHVTSAFYPAIYWGGPIFALFGLCNSLAARTGIRLKVLTTDTAGPRVAERVAVSEFPARFLAGYNVYFTKRRFGIAISPGLLWHLCPMIRWANVIHLTGTYSFPVIPTLFLCRALRKPVVWSPNGGLQRWAGSSRPRLKWLWEHVCNTLLVPNRAVLHVTSEDEEKESASRIPRARIALIPNGVEIPALPRVKAWKPQGHLRLMYIGRLDPIKGIENVLSALALSSNENSKLAIYGRGDPRYEKCLRTFVATLGLQDRVQFHGTAIGERKLRAFLEADVCVVPSYRENFGMVVAEALAHGVPVIASTGSPWADLERHGCGLWVDNAPESLALAISKIGKCDLEGMGRKGRDWMASNFAWSEIARHMDSIYTQLTRETS